MNRHTSDKGPSPAEQGLGYLFKSEERGRSPDAQLVEKVARAMWAGSADPDLSGPKWEEANREIRKQFRRYAATALSAYNPNERLREAATAFVDKLVECQSDIDRVFAFAHTHGHIYQGPQYGEELKTLRAALFTAEPDEEVGALKHDLTRQMSIANAECNEAERLREALTEARRVFLEVYGHARNGPTLSLIDAALSRTIPID